MAKPKARKRTDKKGRILNKGESQQKNGRYVFKYQDQPGKPRFLYSWKLEENDKLPSGKRPCVALRTQEKEVLRDRLDGIDTVGGKITVCQLYAQQNALKPNVKQNTVRGRENLMRILKDDILGSMTVDSVKPLHAKSWAIRMSEKYSYQTINTAKRTLKACFYTAIENDLVRKNPFNWKLNDVIQNDIEAKTVLTKEQENAFLEFVKTDTAYQRHHNAIVILLNTGLRISELCGLTVKDIDFKNGYIAVNHQLLYDKDGYYITTLKTKNSKRQIPIIPVVEKALRNQIRSLKEVPGMQVDGYSNFLFRQKKGTPMYGSYYATVFSDIVKKYNKHHTDDVLHKITPHTCRHTFCTNMANKGMPVKILQYIMGHKNVMMTMNYYAHGSKENAKTEMLRLAV